MKIKMWSRVYLVILFSFFVLPHGLVYSENLLNRQPEGRYFSKGVHYKITRLKYLLYQKMSKGEDVSEAVELDYRSKEAYQSGDSEKAIKLIEEAIRILETENNGTGIAENKKNRKNDFEKIQPMEIEIPVSSSKVYITETVPKLDSGSLITNEDSLLDTITLKAKAGKIRLTVSGIPLIVEEVDDKINKSEESSKSIETSEAHFGIQDHFFKFDARLKDLNTTWVRQSSGPSAVVWDIVEPEKGKYNWALSDRSLNDLHNNGIHILATIRSVNSWDQKRDNNRKKGTKLVHDMDAYLNFLREAVKRYLFVDVWRIENEPNLKVYWADTPGNYLKLLRSSYKVIKEVNPDALVMIGGVSGPFHLDKFWSVIFHQLGKEKERCFDIFDCHWFHFNNPNMQTLDQLSDYIGKTRKLLNKAGYGDVPIWMTEMACYTGKPEIHMHSRRGKLGETKNNFREISEKEQAAFLIKLMAHALSEGASKIFWSKIMENHRFANNPSNGYFDNIGLIYHPKNKGMSHRKLSYYSYKILTKKLGTANFYSVMKLKSDRVSVYKFINKGKFIYVVWSD